MFMPALLLIAMVGGIITGSAATALTVRVLGQRAVIDMPNQRSSHTRPTVRGGGIGLATGTLVALAIAHTDLVGSDGIAIVIAGIVFGAVGLADDLTGSLPVAIRLALQLVAAVVVVVVLWEHTSHGVLWVAVVGALATVWIVGFVNAFNFMDGINGISCTETIVAGVVFGLLGRREHQLAFQVTAFAVVAGAIAFAPFNFPTARVFLGDVGSYFAGAWLAVLVLIGLRGSIPPEAMFAPVALYATDTAVTLARRVHRHEPWHEAHHQHTYQQLVDLGWSHTQTTGLIFGLVTLCSVLGSVSIFGSISDRVAADCGVAMLVAGYLVLPGLIENRHSSPRLSRRASRVFRSGADR